MKLKRKIEQGESLPRFFLPVEFNPVTGMLDCYVFWLAPWILLFLIIKNCSRSIWGDLVYFNRGVEKRRGSRKR
jgi:hypothetical protein